MKRVSSPTDSDNQPSQPRQKLVHLTSRAELDLSHLLYIAIHHLRMLACLLDHTVEIEPRRASFRHSLPCLLRHLFHLLSHPLPLLPFHQLHHRTSQILSGNKSFPRPIHRPHPQPNPNLFRNKLRVKILLGHHRPRQNRNLRAYPFQNRVPPAMTQKTLHGRVLEYFPLIHPLVHDNPFPLHPLFETPANHVQITKILPHDPQEPRVRTLQPVCYLA
ncbi:RNA polymerase-associated protein RapA [Striga asiatica]|uniref:RNA polymerase-associated protein RapA n=1 Tax=Striga asiatica TaxID=4170 RepID=A0A5A7P9E5_STRAF|nr:RNA polymerase-associated protein RapA [Striga asiatica]